LYLTPRRGCTNVSYGGVILTENNKNNDAEWKKLMIFLIIVSYIIMAFMLLLIDLINTWGTERPLNYTMIFLGPIFGIIFAGLLLSAFFSSAGSTPDDETDDYPMHDPDFRRWKLWHDDITGAHERHMQNKHK